MGRSQTTERGGDRKLQGDRLVPLPECAVVNRSYGICWVCAVVNRAYGDENAGVGALFKRASLDARL